jgi:hypothetical protein
MVKTQGVVAGGNITSGFFLSVETPLSESGVAAPH